MSNNILLLGGTGKTGRRVAERLSKQNLPFRIGSRKQNPPFDWGQSELWPDVLKDIQKVYITFQPDLAVAGSAEKISLFVSTAVKKGVKKLVLLSGRGEPEAGNCEKIVMNSGVDWTVVRVSWFMQNFSENFLLDAVLAGEVVLPEMKSLEPFIDTDDIADVVVAALTDKITSNRIYELTGPELLSFERAVSLISSVSKRDILYREIPIEDYTALLRDYQLPEDDINLIRYLFNEVMDGRNESITNDMEQVLARKPTSFEEYVSKTYRTGIWNI